MNLSHNQTVRLLQVINHVLLLVGLYYGISTGEYQLLWYSLFTYWITGILGINIGLHRLLSHRSFKTYTPIYYALSLIGTLTAMGSPIAWVALHRQHHRYSDTTLDPHSPHNMGVFHAWLGFWGKIKIDLNNCKDLRKNNFQRFLHKNYLKINLLYVIVLFLINPLFVIFLYAIPAVLVFHSAGALDVISHIHGYKSYETNDKSTNSWIANLITLGEGWHNNHHAKPYAWSNWERWWEFDIPSLVIRVIKK